MTPTNVLQQQPGTIFKTNLCVCRLTPAQITLQEQLIFKIIRPYPAYMKNDEFKNNTDTQDSLISHVLNKVNEYAEFLICLGKEQPYCAQLLLENTIMVLEKEYEAPQYTLDKLQESV